MPAGGDPRAGGQGDHPGGGHPAYSRVGAPRVRRGHQWPAGTGGAGRARGHRAVAERGEGQVPGVHRIEHLQDERSLIGILDDIEIAGKLRDVYDKALLDKKYSDANKSIELMGTMIGLFGSNKKSVVPERTTTKSNIKNDVSAFQDEDDETTTTASKIASVEKLMKNLKD